MKILLSAYACEPGRGSEPGVGWNMAKALARRHEVWVLTSATHRAAIETELREHPDANLHVVYLDPLGQALDWSRKTTRWLVYPHYYLWQVRAYFVARSLHRRERFDVSHHVTYMKYSTPSFISLLPPPFFFGPVGGGESTPEQFAGDFSSSAQMYERQRGWARRIGEWDPFVRLTMRRSFVWAATEETAQRVRRMGARRVEVSSGMGLSEFEREALERLPVPPVSPIRFISMGRLLHWKGFHLGIRAFAKAGLPDAEYWILGDGPERQALEVLAANLGVSEQVRFFGELDRQSALARIGECHVLVHPSLHDSGGWVCLEAMAAGRPVVCLDLSGPAVQVTDDTGFRIAAHDPDQAVGDLSAAMTRLAGDQALRARMGHAGQHRVEHELSWDRLVDKVESQYRAAV